MADDRGFFEKATQKIKTKSGKTRLVAKKHRKNALKGIEEKEVTSMVQSSRVKKEKAGGNFDSAKQRRKFFGKVKGVKDSDTRSDRAKAQDSRITAKKVYPFSEKGIRAWRRNPNGTDLKYVDTPAIIKEAKRVVKKKAEAKVKAKRARKQKEEVEKVVKRRRMKRVKRAKSKKQRAPARKKLTGIEIENLKRIADKNGVARDQFDFTALIDKSLNFQENKANLEPLIRLQGRTIEFEDESERYDGELKIFISELEVRLEDAETSGERTELRGQIDSLKETRGL